MKKLLLYLFIIPLMIGMSCNDDEGTTPIDDEIDLTDVNALTDAITIQGATLIAGTPPAPSTDSNAPFLEDGTTSTKAGVGANAALDLDVPNGGVEGVYFQIKGADKYFDIPISSLKSVGGRIEESFVLDIPIPDGLGVGTFCADYCVYDTENRVSNIVEVCVEIVSLGGENSSFLTANAWKVVKEIEMYEGMTFEDVIGETFSETFEITVSCEGGGEEPVTITEQERTDFIFITFSSNGAISIEGSEYDRYFDFNNSTCQNLLYIEEESLFSAVGIWSYDDATNLLTLVVEEEEDGESFTDVQEFEVTLANGQLTLFEEFDEDGDGVDDASTSVILEPKN